MVDSDSVGIGGEVAAGVADLPVVPEACGEGEQSDARCGRRGRAGCGLRGARGRVGPCRSRTPIRWPWRMWPQRAEAGLLVAAVGAQQARSLLGDEALEVLAREALVGDKHVAGERQPLEQLLGDLALGGVGRGELEARSGCRRARRPGRAGSPRSSANGSCSSRSRRHRRIPSAAWSPWTGRMAPGSSRAA